MPIDQALKTRVKGSNQTLGELIGTGNLSLDEYREFVLLHELFHLNDKEGKYGEQGDTNLIRTNCFASPGKKK